MDDLNKQTWLARLQLWYKRPVTQLMIAPVVLTVMLAALVSFNPESPQQTPPPSGPVDIMAVVPETAPYLELGEELRLGTKYEGNKVATQMGAGSVFQGNLVLVNQVQRLPEDYEAADLVEVRQLVQIPNSESFSVSKAQMLLNQQVIDQLLLLVRGAFEDGVGGYTLVSGHRDLAYQVGLFQRKINQYIKMGYDSIAAENQAKQIVAVPGESEHHTGLALDLPSRYHPSLTIDYRDTNNGTWLAEHAGEYGFVIRYPADKIAITGISYEPWHLRYVGKPHSELMQRENWCLEEYIEVLRQQGGLTARLTDGTLWQIDYAMAKEGLLEVPLTEDYSLSGDGLSGYIITTPLPDKK